MAAKFSKRKWNHDYGAVYFYLYPSGAHTALDISDK